MQPGNLAWALLKWGNILFVIYQLFTNYLNLFFISLYIFSLIFDRLMKRLGYERYYVQGGDWGAIIGSAMATLYPEKFVNKTNH